MLVQRRRRWADVVQMLYKCFVFDGKASLGPTYFRWPIINFHPYLREVMKTAL